MKHEINAVPEPQVQPPELNDLFHNVRTSHGVIFNLPKLRD